MMLHEEAKTLGMPWEARYGYVHTIKVDDTIYQCARAQLIREAPYVSRSC